MTATRQAAPPAPRPGGRRTGSGSSAGAVGRLAALAAIAAAFDAACSDAEDTDPDLSVVCRDALGDPERCPSPVEPAPSEGVVTLTVAGLGAEAHARQSRDLLGVNGPYADWAHVSSTASFCPNRLNVDLTRALSSAGVTSIRNHDLGGPLDMVVMWSRRETVGEPASYDFTGTRGWNYTCGGAGGGESLVLGFDSNAVYQWMDEGFEPFLRLGDSWDDTDWNLDRHGTSFTRAAVRRQWALAAADVVGHLYGTLSDRLDGGHVEIWNEPDLDRFWRQILPQYGTAAELSEEERRQAFFELYHEVASELRSRYPRLSIGGPAFSSGVFREKWEWVETFLAAVAYRSSPLDFVSFHSYSSDPSEIVDGVARFAAALDAAGLSGTRIVVSEWHATDGDTGTQVIAARATAKWIALHRSNVDRAFLFRAVTPGRGGSGQHGLFRVDDAGQVVWLPESYAFQLWAELLAGRPSIVNVTASSTRVAVTATADVAASETALLVVNTDAAATRWRASFPRSSACTARMTVVTLAEGVRRAPDVVAVGDEVPIAGNAVQLVTVPCSP